MKLCVVLKKNYYYLNEVIINKRRGEIFSLTLIILNNISNYRIF